MNALEQNHEGRETVDALQSYYRSGENDLRQDFFLPCLTHSNWYRRAAGYFSSTALVSWAGILPSLVASRATHIDLLVSPEVPEPDLKALKTVASESDRDRVRQRLADTIVLDATQFKSTTADVELRIRLFTWLVASGRLTLRFAFPHHVEQARIYHEKIGLFSFPWGAKVAFTGSANETEGGHSDNWESLDVFRDWVPADRERVEIKEKQFTDAWEGVACGLRVLPLSPEAMARLKERAPNTWPTASPPDKQPLIAPARWRHQDDAVAAFLTRERGVLEMATGTGKTRTALRIVRDLVTTDQISTIIVAMDGNDLMDQWYDQLTPLSQGLGRALSVARQYGPHKERDQFLLDPANTILLASRPNLRPALAALSQPQGERTLLIHDEVHRLGSPGNRTELAGLSDRVRFRLGLSATPEREYDQDGTAFIEQHVGPVIYRFELQDAIERGILSPFDYHPIEWRPDQDDRERIRQLYKRKSAREAAGKPMSQEEFWIELSNVYKTSKVKTPLFRDFVHEHPELLERCIVFVPTTEYGDDVLEIVHQYRHDFHTYYADDGSETLRRFARGDLECLITCHRLSEGIDIQSLRSVFLLSSDRARLETIQRIGRCLRVDPLNPAKRAQVVDFVRIRDPNDSARDPTSDEVRRDWLLDLASLQPEVSP